MSKVLDAMILLHLDVNAGQHLGVAELAAQLHVYPALVAIRLEQLADANGLVLKRINGLVFSAGVPRRVLSAPLAQFAGQPCA